MTDFQNARSLNIFLTEEMLATHKDPARKMEALACVSKSPSSGKIMVAFCSLPRL
jgi:hypothetical protein